MYIQAVRVTLCCENPGCDQQLELWPQIRDAAGNYLEINRQAILEAVQRKHWLVRYGVVFCSEACEQASLNQEIKS